jgi:hypothetical protein
LSSLLIPKNLKENAVIRLNKEIITFQDIHKTVVSKRRVVTVLNKSGDRYVHAYTFCNNDQKNSKLYATAYNAFGEKNKEILKKQVSR